MTSSPRRRLVRVSLAAGALGACVATAAATASHSWTRRSSRGRVTDVDHAPTMPWAVVLGAGLRDDGTPINTLRYRLDRAVELYRGGACARILVSGGVRPGSDEIAAMTNYLLAREIPADHITADPYGNNTFNSAQRAAHVFGIESALVVTQRFHIHRAVALFRSAGIDAVGVADDEGRRERWTWRKGVVREWASNVKALSDVVTGRPYLSPETDPRPAGGNHPAHREAS